MESDANSISGSQGPAGFAMATVRAKGPHLLRRLHQGISRFELVYTPHPLWPLRPNTPCTQTPLRLSILDASFNPPTRAHLGLANSRWSPPTAEEENGTKIHYDAKLLLLSVKNADKTLKPGDATYLQRLEMMALLLNHIRPDTSTLEEENPFNANVAIAIIDEPTFVGKSATLLTHLRDRFTAAQIEQEVELSFLVGMDTQERLFSPRYYASEEAMINSLRKFFSPAPEGDNSRIVCARRASVLISQPSSSFPSNQPSANKELTLAQDFINSGRILVIDMGDELSTYSSTSVRRAVSSLGVIDHDQSGASAWRKLVTKDVADYIVRERLYEGTL
jgi:nicotinamide-nucleotide adenylyltransferase